MASGLETIRVRFAPSPTGFMHIGNVRAALFNWIFARANNGKFIVRIENTDRERSKKEYEKDILDGLNWLGLNYDGLYLQSDRTEIYKTHLKKLIDENKAYYCFCSKEELDGERESRASAGLLQIYSGKCRILTKDQGLKRAIDGEKFVIRFKNIDKKITFKDLVKGEVGFDTSLIGDTVIAKDLNNPLYNFAVVVDDYLMNITHIIRGEDHISNTPKQILLAEAFGFKTPKFAHLPLVLNADRSKMSKRFLDVALKDYKEEGYLKDAIINFLAFLGWHPKEDKEIMSLSDIVKEFTLERVQKSGAIFNTQKLDWLNAHYINSLSVKDFISSAKPYLPANWELTDKMAFSVRPRVKKMSEIKELAAFYFNLPEYSSEKLRWKGMALDKVAENLKRAHEIINKIDEGSFNKEKIEAELIENSKDIKKGEIFWPLRFALSGSEASPTPFEMIEALGKKQSLGRIELAISKI